MRTLRIDFRSDDILPDGCIAGRTGEHNATTLIITPPDEMLNSEEAKNFCIVFETGSEIIHSKVMVKSETLKISLWKQLTKNKCLAVQVEAYDGNGEFVAKSPTVSLILRPSLEGNNAQTDTENPDFISEFIKTKHFHENKDILDKLNVDTDGNLTYNGQNVGGNYTLTEADKTEITNAVLDEIPEIPTKTSQLVNDSNFVTAEYVTNAINGSLDEIEAMIDESGVLDG